MPLFGVMNDDADLCYLVNAKSKKEAKQKVLDLVAKPGKRDLASFKRLRGIAAKKSCGMHVLLKVAEYEETLPGIYSLNE